MTYPEVDAEVENLLFWLGCAYSQLAIAGDPAGMRKETADALWVLIPFVKALCVVARHNQPFVRDEWRKALEEAMPFGCAPIGLPKEPEP